MKKLLLTIAVLSIFLTAFSIEFSVLGGMELSGKSRQFVGARIGFLDSILGLSIEAYSPVSSFESSTQELQNVEFIEIDPYVLLNLSLGDMKVYTGIAPMVIADIQTGDFGLFSMNMFHAKVGIRYGKGISLFVDGMTTFTTKFESTGIYSVMAGIGLNF